MPDQISQISNGDSYSKSLHTPTLPFPEERIFKLCWLQVFKKNGGFFCQIQKYIHEDLKRTMPLVSSFFLSPFFNKQAGIIQWNEQYNQTQKQELGAKHSFNIPDALLPSSNHKVRVYNLPSTQSFLWRFQILSDFCWSTLKFTSNGCCNRFIMRRKSPASSNEDKTTPLGKKKDQFGSQIAKRSNSGDSRSFCQSPRKKKIIKKPESLLARLRLESPLTPSPVFNLFNLIGFNQSSMRNPDSEESYFKTIFYMRVVERAQLRKHALILQLKTTEQPAQPIQYLINRYKSFGDRKFYELALTLERTAAKLQQPRKEGFTQQLMRSFDGEPLSRFIDSMAGEIYMCKVAPNKLVISRPLLELLGEDPEAYSIEMCKYKAPLREIISAELYSEIMTKTLQHLGLLCDYMAGQLTHDELHAQTSVNFNDYIYDRHQKRIHCNFVLFMPTPQISCVQMREVIRESQRAGKRCPIAQRKSLMLDEHCQQRRFKEAEVLKNIVKLPQGMLKDNQRRVAGYKTVSTE